MTDPDEFYPVNTIPAVAWALHLYIKKNGKLKHKRIIELTFPAGRHKEKMRTKGEHEISVWISDGQVFVRARCTYDKKCEFNSERVEGRDRDGLKSIDWTEINSRKFFKMLVKWLMRHDFDYVLFIRALATVCDKKVEIPLTTQYGRTFEKFDEYRRNKWPEDIKPNDKEGFLEEVLVRVSFWFQTAATVGVLK